MPEARNQFTFYRSYYDAIQELGKKDQSAIILAVCAYALYEEEPRGLSPAASTAFKLIRPTLDSGRKKAANGKQGGKTGKQNASNTEANRKQTEREKEIEKEIEIEIEIETDGKEWGRSDYDFGKLLDEYPTARLGNRRAAQEAFRKEVHSPEDTDKVMANLALWKKSEQWTKDGGQYIPYLVNWLERGIWNTKPPETNLKERRDLDEDELEAIRRMMEEERP